MSLRINLPHNEVHVWQLSLSNALIDWFEYAELLSKTEQDKVARFRNPLHRSRAMAVRVQLRLLLSHYLMLEPQQIDFQTEQYGKPVLSNTNLAFNLSHSGSDGLVAVSMNSQMGVDIEHWRSLDNLDGMVERNFSATEKEIWLRVPKEQQTPVFFHHWTAKEAFIKATGRGLGMGLARCSFDIAGDTRLLACPAEYGRPEDWQSHQLAIGEKKSATLVIKAKASQLVLKNFNPKL